MDVLRITAIFFVIFVHVVGEYWLQLDCSSFEWNIVNVYDSISRWSFPVLVMISGALFLTKQEQDIQVLYKQYVLRMITAYLFWSAIYLLINYVFYNRFDWKNAILFFIQGYYHLWFLPMMAGLYMIVPFLKCIIKLNQLTKYFLVLATIFTSVIPFLIIIVAVFSEALGNALGVVSSNMHFAFLAEYVGYFVAGYYLHKTSIQECQRKAIYLVGVIGTIGIISLTKWLTMLEGKQMESFYNPLLLPCVLQAIAVYVFAKTCLLNVCVSKYVEQFLKRMSKYSLGACLVHPLVIIVMRELLGVTFNSLSILWMLPIYTVVVFFISYAFSALLNHIPILNKYIV